jgi:hypothetical protein
MPYFSGDSEGEALSDILEDGRTAADEARECQAREIAKLHRLKLYDAAKAAKTGTECKCPSCGKTFTKKSYQQAFCSNKGRNNCKDRYWNRATNQRSERSMVFNIRY